MLLLYEYACSYLYMIYNFSRSARISFVRGLRNFVRGCPVRAYREYVRGLKTPLSDISNCSFKMRMFVKHVQPLHSS